MDLLDWSTALLIELRPPDKLDLERFTNSNSYPLINISMERTFLIVE
jgi:hypothetical protein